MNKPLPISCFIIAMNEADRIAATINSVKGWVSEIIVIDSGSSDDTVSVAAFHGARVLHHDWQGYGMQKRFGEEQCTQDWLLNLDADEVVTAELATEISQIFEAGMPALAGYFLKVRDLLPGERKLAKHAHTNHCLRLYNKHKARFSDSPVHDSVLVREGKTVELEHPVLHRSFRSLAHMLEKINSYSNVQAEDLLKKGIKYPHLRLFVELKFGFIKLYFLRGYIYRGWRGFIYSVVYAFGRFLRIAKYIELKNEMKEAN
jgi:glycosyltransferase involved in cell wall biosynthesis